MSSFNSRREMCNSVKKYRNMSDLHIQLIIKTILHGKISNSSHLPHENNSMDGSHQEIHLLLIHKNICVRKTNERAFQNYERLSRAMQSVSPLSLMRALGSFQIFCKEIKIEGLEERWKGEKRRRRKEKRWLKEQDRRKERRRWVGEGEERRVVARSEESDKSEVAGKERKVERVGKDEQLKEEKREYNRRKEWKRK